VGRRLDPGLDSGLDPAEESAGEGPPGPDELRDDGEQAGAFAEEEEEEEGEADDRDSEPYPSMPRPRWAMSPRRLRVCELALVLLVAFGPTLLTSLWAWWTGNILSTTAPVRSLINIILRQALELGLLAYVLFRRGQTFRDLGLTFRWTDLPAAGLLYFASVLVHAVAHNAVNWLTIVATGHRADFALSRAPIAGVTAIALYALYAIVDPVDEELIVRAFAMTEIEELTGSAALAVAASVGLQTAYHLYQGAPNALAAGAGFLLYACFYARFRRILPVILAHACWDLLVVWHRAAP
jgi:membrane protease YdiL (CAAX protease family)